MFWDSGKYFGILGSVLRLLGIALGHWEELSWNWCGEYRGELRLTTERTLTRWFRYAICSCEIFFDSSDHVYSVHTALHEIFPFFFRLFWLFFIPLSLISWSTPRGAICCAWRIATVKKSGHQNGKHLRPANSCLPCRLKNPEEQLQSYEREVQKPWATASNSHEDT